MPSYWIGSKDTKVDRDLIMSKVFVPKTPMTPADQLREMIDQAEQWVAEFRQAGQATLELLPLLDTIEEKLSTLEATGADVRAERARWETVQRQLKKQQGRFLREVGDNYVRARAQLPAPPDTSQWWWFMDRAVAARRRRAVRTAALIVSGVLLLVVAAWWAYDHFIAPPPEVRQALQYSFDGELAAESGDDATALAEFEAAARLTPDDPEVWLWIGVLHTRMDHPREAEAAFEQARRLYDSACNFYLERGMLFLRLKDLDAARQDAEQAIAEDPQAGWAYYLRANVASAQGDQATALADLERAIELAQAAGDPQLEAMARAQWGMLIQLAPIGAP